MKVLQIEKLSQTVTLFSPTQCDFFSENCIVALEINNHTTGCKLSVSGDVLDVFTVNWNKQFNRAGYKEEKKIIEHAAETIAFFLTPKLTEFSIIEEAIIGTGIDYWIGYDESHEKYNPKNFLQARLEISGINIESQTNTIEKRVKQKKQQANKSKNSKLPAYVSITEFASPKSHFSKK